MIQYETFIPDQVATLKRMLDFFGFDININLIIQFFEENETIKKSRRNFNKGTCYRWRTELSIEELEKCNYSLQNEIATMGYSFL